MLNLNQNQYPNEVVHLNRMKSLNTTMSSICFSLAMRSSMGEVVVYERNHQPCYGELRKYLQHYVRQPDGQHVWTVLHQPETVTQEHPKQKPTDLYHPFPDGTPEAVGFGMYDRWGEGIPAIHEFMLSNESPWYPVLKGSHQYDKHGLIIIDTDIDPTVLVNLMNSFKSVATKMYDMAVEKGMSKIEALVLAMYLYNDGRPNTYTGYYHPGSLDLYRLSQAKPRDLTGGTLRDRFDYNRKNLHSVFETEGSITKWNVSKFLSEGPCKQYVQTDWRTPVPKFEFTDELAETFRAEYERVLSIQAAEHDEGLADVKPKEKRRPRLVKDIEIEMVAT